MMSKKISFPPISKHEWLEKIKADLKGRELSDSNWHFSEKIAFDPFVHADDISSSEFNHLIFNRSSQQIPLARISKEDSSNLTSQLNAGAGAIWTEQGVTLPEELNTNVVLTYSDDEVLNISIRTDDFDNFSEAIVQGLRSSLMQEKYPRLIVVSMSDHIYLNIAALRAVRLMIDQLDRDLDGNLGEIKIAGVYESGDSDDVANDLQLTMPKVFAAYVGGADHIGPINISNVDSIKWYHNLVNLLCYESDISGDKDICAGAYLFERLTNLLADHMWESLRNAVEIK